MIARTPLHLSAGLFLALAFASFLRAADSFSSVYISEFLAENRRGERDEERQRHGWIELHNGGRKPVNLAGWFLTDEASNPTKWRIPGVVLLPDKQWIVFASGKNRTSDLVWLHTNFRLNPAGGYLALVNAATNIMSEFTNYPAQSADVSFGRVPGEPEITGALHTSTPSKPNVSSGTGFAPEVIFSKSSHNFVEPFALALSCSDTGAVIRYTQDGTLPNRGSPVYAAPLTITNTAHIRARAFRDGLLPGPPVSAAYLKLFTNVLEFTSTLPVLVMDTFGTNVAVGRQNQFVHLSLHEPVNGKTSLTNPPTLTTRAGFRVRGSTSSGFAQTPFAVEFIDEFNEERPLPLLGLPADSDWVLYAPNPFDPVMIHNSFIHELSRQIGRYSPRTRFIEVFVVRSRGRVRETHYHGVYVLTEKISIGKHRVNIDRAGSADLTPPKVTGGYLLKIDRVGPGESGFAANDGRGIVYVEPREETMNLPQRAPQRDYLKGYFADFERALHGPDWKDPVKGYRAFLDVEAAIDFHVVELLSGNVDALVLSTYFYKPRQGRITFEPHWDFDRALGSIDERDANPRQWQTGPFFGGAWWPRLFSDPDFWQLWVDRWQEMRANHFALTNLFAIIDRQCAELREAQPREYVRWGLQPRGGSYASEIAHMKNWLSNRINFIDGQLVQPPQFSEPGGRVASGTTVSISFTPADTNTVVHFTLDGSDPRLPQGGVSSNAVRYSGAITITNDMQIVARCWNDKRVQTGGPPVSTPWSRGVRADFRVKQ